MRTPADRVPEDGTPNPERTLGRDAEPLGLREDRRFNFSAATPPADHPMRQPGDGTPMLGPRGEFVRGRADDGADGFYAVPPPGVSRLGRVREHEPAHCLGDVTRVYAAADIAGGERGQLEMVALTGNDAAHQFRVVARLGAGSSPRRPIVRRSSHL